MKTLDEIEEFHGHVCPGLAIGYRVSLAALKRLGKRAEDEELVAIVENDSCAVDALQVMTGCTFGKGNLIFNDYGKQVYTFFTRGDKKALRLSLKKLDVKESKSMKEAWAKYSNGDRSKAVLEAVRKRKSERLKTVLNAKETVLLDIKYVKADMPPQARIYPSLVCSSCKELVMEPRARMTGGKMVCIPCFIMINGTGG